MKRDVCISSEMVEKVVQSRGASVWGDCLFFRDRAQYPVAVRAEPSFEISSRCFLLSSSLPLYRFIIRFLYVTRVLLVPPLPASFVSPDRSSICFHSALKYLRTVTPCLFVYFLHLNPVAQFNRNYKIPLSNMYQGYRRDSLCSGSCRHNPTGPSLRK